MRNPSSGSLPGSPGVLGVLGVAAVLALLAARPAAGQQAPAPVIDTVFSTDSTMVVRYTVSGGPDVRYGVHRMDRSKGFWERIRAGTTFRSESGREDRAVELGKEYCYLITARLPDQRGPTQSESRCAVYDGGDPSIRPPEAPEDLTVTTRRTHVLVLEFVDVADDETAFGVERRHADVSGWVEVARLDDADGTGRTVRHTDAGVEMEQRYCYRVRAYNRSRSAARRPPALRARDRQQLHALRR
jgi:hypothetical protein